MRTLFYQPSAGIAGDLHLAALLDLGVPLDYVQSHLQRLTLSGEFDLQVEAAKKMGISGTKVEVHARDSHDHRHYSFIVDLIRRAELPKGAEQRALDVFALIAEAEARIHGIDIEKVHFHEVGAIDSIVDIVAGALAIDYLNVEHVVSHSVEVGSGHVDCAHGRFPVPAPAAQEILAGVPCRFGGINGEATTPTGAAILRATVDVFEPQQAFTPQQFGYGIGHKDFAIPNVLRVVLGEMDPAISDLHYQLEANIDDMSAEAIAPLTQALFKAGAADVYCTPIVMKKSRPATTVTVLSSAANRQHLGDILLNQSSTIGLREFAFSKRVLPRQLITLSTEYGEVRVKQVTQPDGRLRHKVEHDDIEQLAAAQNMDYQSMRRLLEFEVQQQLGRR